MSLFASPKKNDPEHVSMEQLSNHLFQPNTDVPSDFAANAKKSHVYTVLRDEKQSYTPESVSYVRDARKTTYIIINGTKQRCETQYVLTSCKKIPARALLLLNNSGYDVETTFPPPVNGCWVVFDSTPDQALEGSRSNVYHLVRVEATVRDNFLETYVQVFAVL